MAGKGQDIRYQAGEAFGQAQMKKDRAMDKASEAAQSAKESCKEGADQAGGFLQQTGEQVKQMAQGAAEAVKNTLGMGDRHP